MLEGPAPKILDIKQRRLEIPEEAKEVRTAGAPAHSREKDSRPRCEEGNPGWAGQRTWRRESRGVRASVGHRVESWGGEENFKICWRPPSNIRLSPDEQMTVRKLLKSIPGSRAQDRVCFPQDRRQNLINHGWWTRAGEGQLWCQPRQPHTDHKAVNDILLTYSRAHFLLYLLGSLSCYRDKIE